IPEKLYERTDTLSGGQQQRVAIARALFQDPVAILADEPVASVDPGRARSLLELLTGVARDEGITLVMSLHHVELAREFFPRLIGLQAGRVVFDQSADETTDRQLRELYATGEE
ncbi:MAG: ATP-binding cassette domain-containing protein, partial [Roseibacillus sp.]|nr:ATP-binding cassette domain-containing protein [Roseibacillus sp.]